MKPEAKFKAGGVSATIWKNQSANGEFATVTLSKSYMDKDKNWKETNSYNINDLAKVKLVVDEAFRRLSLKPAEPQLGAANQQI